MEKPHYSTDDLYKVMRDCWLSEPGLRPTFNELVEKMSDELQEGEKQVCLQPLVHLLLQLFQVLRVWAAII